jgi:hypothetical protein
MLLATTIELRIYNVLEAAAMHLVVSGNLYA